MLNPRVSVWRDVQPTGPTYKFGVNEDGEHGGACSIMEDANITNSVVIITQWYGGIHLGLRRFTVIYHCTTGLIN